MPPGPKRLWNAQALRGVLSSDGQFEGQGAKAETSQSSGSCRALTKAREMGNFLVLGLEAEGFRHGWLAEHISFRSFDMGYARTSLLGQTSLGEYFKDLSSDPAVDPCIIRSTPLYKPSAPEVNTQTRHGTHLSFQLNSP